MGAIVYKYRGIWSAEAWRSFHGNPLKPTKIIGLSRKPLHTFISPPPRTLSIHLKRCTIPFLPPPPPPRAFLPPRAVVALEPPRVSLLMKVPYETPTPSTRSLLHSSTVIDHRSLYFLPVDTLVDIAREHRFQLWRNEGWKKGSWHDRRRNMEEEGNRLRQGERLTSGNENKHWVGADAVE